MSGGNREVPAVSVARKEAHRALQTLSQRRRLGLRLHPLFVDLGLTGFTSAAVLVTGLVVVSIFGKTLGAVALAEYLLLRRIYSWLQSVTLAGIDSALPRYVAMNDDRPRERTNFLLAGVLCGGAVMLLAFAILNGAGGLFGQWLFGAGNLRGLVLALSLFLMGGDAHGIVYGFYRGRLAMKRANTLQVINLVAVPIACVLVLGRTNSTALIVDAMGGLMLAFSCLFALPLLPQILKLPHRGLRVSAKKLLEYGVPRLPSIFALGATLALGPMIASQKMPLSHVTPLLLGMSILMGVASSAEPLGLILLSKVSMFVSQNRKAELRVHLLHLQEAVVACYAFVCLQLIVFADVLVRAWVGNRIAAGGLGVIRLTLIAIPFYLLFASLRSVIDATSVTPYNTFNVLVTSGAFVVFAGAAVRFSTTDDLLSNIAVATVAAIALLAVLTIRTLRKMYGVEIRWRQCGAALALSAALGGCSYAARLALGSSLNLISAVAIGMTASAIFIIVIKGIGASWLPFFWNLAFQRRPVNV